MGVSNLLLNITCVFVYRAVMMTIVSSKDWWEAVSAGKLEASGGGRTCAWKKRLLTTSVVRFAPKFRKKFVDSRLYIWYTHS